MPTIAMVVMFVILTQWAPTAGAVESVPSPVGKRLLLQYGDYLSPPGSLIQTLITVGEPGKSELGILGLGRVHASIVDFWKSGSADWISGAHKVADDDMNAKTLRPFEGRKADLVVVQLDLRYAMNNKGDPEKTRVIEEAVAGYIAAAKSVGARLVFYVTPGKQHTTYREGSHANEANAIRLTEADHQPELQAMDAECQRLAAKYRAVMAPTFRAFAILRAKYPEIDLHEPIWHGDNGHLSPRDQVLTAMVISRAFLGEGEHPLPTTEVLLAPLNQKITTDNITLKEKGRPEKPLLTIDAATWKAMLEATMAAFAARTNQRPNP